MKLIPQKLELRYSENCIILTSTVFWLVTHVMDGQTDGS